MDWMGRETAGERRYSHLAGQLAIHRAEDLLQEHRGVERFEKVGRAAGFCCQFPALQIVVGRDEHSGQVLSRRTEVREQFQPAHAPKMNVKDQTLQSLRQSGFEELRRGRTRKDLKSRRFQQPRQRLPDGYIIVYEGHACKQCDRLFRFEGIDAGELISSREDRLLDFSPIWIGRIGRSLRGGRLKRTGPALLRGRLSTAKRPK